VWNVWGRGDVLTWFWWGNMRERDYLEYVGVDGRIVLNRIITKQGRGMNWIDVAQNRDCLSFL